MKYILVYVSFLVFVFHTSCGQTKNTVAPSGSDERNFHTRYEYIDSKGKRLKIQNGYPKGGSQYTDSKGEGYGYAVFWTRIINETDNPLEVKIDFLESYEVPSFPGKYFKILVHPDTMTSDKEGLYSYGLTNLESFLDKNIHKPSSVKRTINPKESSGFYFLKLSTTFEGGAILRTGLILKGQDLYYRVSVYDSMAPPSIISEKEIDCGSINLKNLKLRE